MAPQVHDRYAQPVSLGHTFACTPVLPNPAPREPPHTIGASRIRSTDCASSLIGRQFNSRAPRPPYPGQRELFDKVLHGIVPTSPDQARSIQGRRRLIGHRQRSSSRQSLPSGQRVNGLDFCQTRLSSPPTSSANWRGVEYSRPPRITVLHMGPLRRVDLRFLARCGAARLTSISGDA